MRASEVAIILPYHNSEKTLAEAIESILQQSYKNLKLIAINDHSTDSSEKIAKSFSDSRILHLTSSGKGLVSALNEALLHAKESEYIARMDADDWSHPSRIEAQVEYLSKHPKTDIISTWACIYGSKKMRFPYLNNHYFLVSQFIFQNGLIHPSVLFRCSLLNAVRVNLFNDEFRYAEDYALWAELIPTVQFSIIEKPFLHYRLSESQVSSAHLSQQRVVRNKVRKIVLKNIFHSLKSDEIELLDQNLAILMDELSETSHKKEALEALFNFTKDPKKLSSLEAYARNRILLYLYGRLFRLCLKGHSLNLTLIFKAVANFRTSLLVNIWHQNLYRMNFLKTYKIRKSI